MKSRPTHPSHVGGIPGLLPNGRRFRSNALLGRLLPTLNNATLGAAQPNGSRDITLSGKRLGGANDAIYVVLYKDDGSATHLYQDTGTATQNVNKVNISASEAPASGNYRVILRVNGEQAVNSPQLVWP